MLATKLHPHDRHHPAISPSALAATSPARIGNGDRSPDRTLGNTTETRLAGESRRASRPREGTMAPQDFCQALQKNDRAALKTAIDPELAKLDPSRRRRAQLPDVQAVARTACMCDAGRNRAIHAATTPIKGFNVTVRMDQRNDGKTRRSACASLPSATSSNKK